MTVRGFTRPSVAKGLIELPAGVEKGLAQRISPRPSFAKFDPLELVFQATLVSIASPLPQEDLTVIGTDGDSR